VGQIRAWSRDCVASREIRRCGIQHDSYLRRKWVFLSRFRRSSASTRSAAVSIHDVSARQGQLIAVSATYVKSRGVLPAAVLLILDFGGNLRSAVALDPSREIISLAIDDRLNIWSLAWHSGDKNPGAVPLVTEYSKQGEVLRELFKRTDFPPHEDSIQQGPNIGSVQAGCGAGVFWFWLPKSTDFVEINTTTGAVMNKTKTQSPQVSGQTACILKLVRESSGAIVVEAAVENTRPNDTKDRSLRHYMWSPETKSWTAYDPASTCPDYRLIGVDGDKHLYMRFKPGSMRGSICSYIRR